MQLAELDYPLPEALIAQAPAPERAAARLLVVDRGGAPLRHARVGDLPAFLRAGEVLVRGAPRRGERVHLAGGQGEWVAPLGAGRWRLRLALDEPALAWLERVG